MTRRTALVTGASRGIGRAVATELYTRDVRVVVTARVAEAARRAATGIGPEALSHPLDVVDPESITQASSAIGRRSGST